MTFPRGIASRRVFVDSSAFFAQTDRSDRGFASAKKLFEELAATAMPLVTSNLVVAESHSLMLRKLGRSVAATWLAGAEDLNIVVQDEEDDEAARGIIVRYADKAFSYTDAVSFAIMERLGLTTSFAFDDDFRQYGWDVIP